MAAAPDPDEVLCSTSGKTNFQRITRLLISAGASLLREIFDSKCPPSHLPKILSNPVTKKQLKGAKLNMPQWHCLCPSPGVYGKSADFDVTLLFRLLRTICNLAPPATGWDALPAGTDHSLTADIARIKYYRNSVYGHVNQGMAITDDEFPTLWQEISEALVRIAGQISSVRKTAWQGTIAKYLTDPLTVEDERNLQELEAWYKHDMDVKDAIDHLTTTVQEESKNVKEDISEQFDHLKTTVQEESKNLKEDVKSILDSVREEVQGIKREFKAMAQTTVQEESKNVKDLKSTIELEVPEEAQDIKRESIAMRRDILEAVGHQEAKGISDPPVGMIHSKDKNSSLAAKSQLSEEVTLDNKLAGLTGSETGDINMVDEGALPAALSPGAGLSSLEDLAIPQPEISETCESTVVDGTFVSEPRPGDYNSVSGGYPSEVEKPKKATAGYAGLNISDPGVPLEIYLRGRNAVKSYQDALASGRIALRRVPLMLIGQGGAGKTSTKKSLKGICFDPAQDSTVGIDVDPSYFKVSTETWCTRGQDQDQNSDKEIYFIFWDFAGQSVYYETHSLFLTEKAIVLLVYDLSLNPDDKAKPVLKQGVYDKIEGSYNLKTNFDYLDFWMRSVASFASNEAEGSLVPGEWPPNKLPPVFLVCTHADKPYGRDPKELTTKLFGRLASRPYGAHLCDVFLVDNTLSVKNLVSSEIERLQREIFSKANELSFVNEQIPMKWLKFEEALQVKRQMGNKHISLESARNVAKNECSIVEEENFETLMNYLHDLRSLIHYRDTVQLNKLVVLDPQWLVDVFKKVITVKPYDPKEKKYLHLWHMLESQGILDENLVAHVWEPFFKDKETFESLIGIMERFSLLCPWPVRTSNKNQYLVPSMLKTLPTAKILELVKSAHIPSLFVKFSNGQVPPAFFHRLIVQFMQWGRDWFWSKATPQLFNGFARFYTSEGEYSVSFICNSSSVEVVVHGGNSAHFSPSSGEVPCSQVCRQLGLILGFMQSEFPWLRNMGYEMCVICPVCSKEREVDFCKTHCAEICKQEQCLHFWPLSELCSDARNLHCTKSATAPDIMVETEQFSPWFPAPRQQPETDEYVQESFAVDADSQSTASSEGAKKGKGDLSTEEPASKISKATSSSNPSDADHAEDATSGISNDETKSRKTDSNPPEVDVAVLTNKELPGISKRLDLEQLPIDILLLTVKDCEFLACLSLLTGFSRMFQKELGDVYIGNIGEMKIAVMKCRMGAAGPGSAAGVVRDAVKALTPKAVFCVGYCGGLQPVKVKLGDVVISEELIAYAPSKVIKNGIEERDRVPLKPNLAKVVLNAAAGWSAPLRDPAELEVAPVRGALLSGPQVVDDSDLREVLLNRFPEALAIEMEGEGVYSAAHDLNVEWIIIKGVSDFVDGKNSEKNAWRPFASIMAASFVAHILSNPIIFEDWPHYNNGKTSLPPSSGNQEKVWAVRRVLEHRSSKSCDAKLVVSRLLETIQLDQASLQQPDSNTKNLLRCLGREAIRCDRRDVVEYLRKITPAGTTGPLVSESLDVRTLPASRARWLSIELSGGDGWKLVAEKLGLGHHEIRFLDKRTLNPAEAVLAFVANQRYLSVGELYQILCDCELPAVANLL